jgi:hypothetical protein
MIGIQRHQRDSPQEAFAGSCTAGWGAFGQMYAPLRDQVLGGRLFMVTKKTTFMIINNRPKGHPHTPPHLSISLYTPNVTTCGFGSAERPVSSFLPRGRWDRRPAGPDSGSPRFLNRAGAGDRAGQLAAYRSCGSQRVQQFTA